MDGDNLDALQEFLREKDGSIDNLGQEKNIGGVEVVKDNGDISTEKNEGMQVNDKNSDSVEERKDEERKSKDENKSLTKLKEHSKRNCCSIEEKYQSLLDLHQITKEVEISITRLPDDIFMTHQIINYPNSVNGKASPLSVKEKEKEKEDKDESDESIVGCDYVAEEGEIDVSAVKEELEKDKNKKEKNKEKESSEDSLSYTCIFCKISSHDLEESARHYYQHLDYYPYQCDKCDEVTLDLNLMKEHSVEAHSDSQIVKFIYKKKEKLEKWVVDFLNTQNVSVYLDFVQDYCPACKWDSNKGEETDEKKKQKPSGHKVIGHIHRHLRYSPYECSLCRQEGKEFLIHHTDQIMKSHIHKSHPEQSQSEVALWQYFPKKYPIPKLDEFIFTYLQLFNLKITTRKRKTKRKPTSKKPSQLEDIVESFRAIVFPSQQASSSTSQMNAINNPNTDSNLDAHLQNAKFQSPMLNAALTHSSIDSTIDSVISFGELKQSNTNLPYTIELIKTNGRKLMKVTKGAPSSQQCSQSIASNSFSSNSSGSMIIPIVPFPISIVSTIEDDKFKNSFCVFCTDEIKFSSRTEVCHHYAQHLDYLPVNCLLCQAKFIDMDGLMKHNLEEHTQLNGSSFHYLKEDETIERWIEEFVTFQSSPEIWTMISCIEGAPCPICDRLITKQHLNSMEKISFQKITFKEVSEHLRYHFRYHAYVCLMCQNEGVTSRFACLDKSAVEHLSVQHSIKESELIELLLPKVFAKSQQIDQIEKLIYDIAIPFLKKEEKKPEVAKVTETPQPTENPSLKRKIDEMIAKGDHTAIPLHQTEKPANKVTTDNSINNNQILTSRTFANGSAISDQPVTKVKRTPIKTPVGTSIRTPITIPIVTPIATPITTPIKTPIKTSIKTPVATQTALSVNANLGKQHNHLNFALGSELMIAKLMNRNCLTPNNHSNNHILSSHSNSANSVRLPSIVSSSSTTINSLSHLKNNLVNGAPSLLTKSVANVPLTSNKTLPTSTVTSPSTSSNKPPGDLLKCKYCLFKAISKAEMFQHLSKAHEATTYASYPISKKKKSQGKKAHSKQSIKHKFFNGLKNNSLIARMKEAQKKMS